MKSPGPHGIKLTARLCLGFIWIYQGLVPKLLATVPLEHDIVRRTGLFISSPEATIRVIGLGEIALGLWLLTGWRERFACALTSGLLLVMSVLVAIEEPSLLIGPFGGIIKNVSLFVCAWIVWQLAPRDRLS